MHVYTPLEVHGYTWLVDLRNDQKHVRPSWIVKSPTIHVFEYYQVFFDLSQPFLGRAAADQRFCIVVHD